MNVMQEQVLEFHQKFGATVGDTVGLRDNELRANLITEEAEETVRAILRGDLVETVDGLCDLIYVIYGAAVTFGIDLEPFFNEVHRSNMTKLWEDGKPRYRESDHKVLKPLTYSKPDIKGLLKQCGYSG